MAPAKKVVAAPAPEASGKTQKLPTTFEPLVTFFEKKLRNLEKRKSKLETYKQLQRDGKLTDAGQQAAVAKYDEVVLSISLIAELHQELLPIFQEVGVNIDREINTREKEIVSKSKSAIRNVLNVQDLVDQLGDESIREDFMKGNSNASPLSNTDIEIIDKLYEQSKPSRSRNDGGFVTVSQYKESLHTSTEEWYRLVTKSSSNFAKSQYKYGDLFDLFDRVGSSAYFDPNEKEKLAAAMVIEETEALTDEVPETNNGCNGTSATEEPEPQHLAQNGQDDVMTNGERKRTASEVLGFLQQKAVVSFVQDDVQRNEPEDPAVIIAHPMGTGSMLSRNQPFGGNNLDRSSFNENQFETFTIHPNNNLDSQFGHYSNSELCPPQSNLIGMDSAAQKDSSEPFIGQQSWADEVAGDSFDTHLNSPDNFVEVNKRYGQRGATKGGGPAPGRGNDFNAGRDRYRDDFSRGNRARGGFEASSRGYDSGPRGSFNRPYGNRNEFAREESGALHRRGDDINRPDRNRPFPGKQDAPRGQLRGKPQRNFERPYQGRE